ncbi:MAG: DCC1-like thiol-disulfide oxidoreductase family protein [Myxococcota bacterium]
MVDVAMKEEIPKHWVLWDLDCGFCRRVVRWFERQPGHGQFHVVAYQQAPSPPMTPELRLACARALHVLTIEGRTLRAGAACLFLLKHIGWPRLAGFLALPPMIWFVELGYWCVARNRRIFSRFMFTKE